MSGHLPGFGDPATWPPIGNHGDPRNDGEPKSEIEEAIEFIDQAKRYVDDARAAVFRRDWQEYELAKLNLYELAGGMWA